MLKFSSYDPESFFDELIDPEGKPRPGAKLLVDKIESLPDGDLSFRQKAAEAMLMRMGITFTVYGREDGTEKIFPFDISGSMDVLKTYATLLQLDAGMCIVPERVKKLFDPQVAEVVPLANYGKAPK